jgi:hypothetical protein
MQPLLIIDMRSIGYTAYADISCKITQRYEDLQLPMYVDRYSRIAWYDIIDLPPFTYTISSFPTTSVQLTS